MLSSVSASVLKSSPRRAFEDARQPNGNRAVPDDGKSPWLRARIGSANGSRTRLSALKGPRPNR